MNLKKLHEAALWHKLSESDFRDKTTRTILEQSAKINILTNQIIDLEETVQLLKKQLGLLGSQNIMINKKIRTNMKVNDDSQAEQSRNNKSIS